MRIAYGARAITEGGFQSVPKLAFPGGALIGCAAGFMNVPRIKGSHNAIKTGMMAAEAAFAALKQGRGGDVLERYEKAYGRSRVRRELKMVRNVKPLWSKFGTRLGVALAGVDMTLIERTGWSPFGTLNHGKTDAECTGLAKDYKPIDYPKPDGVITFDKLSSLLAVGHQPRGGPAGPPEADRPERPDRRQPAEVRRAGPALLPGGRL